MSGSRSGGRYDVSNSHSLLPCARDLSGGHVGSPILSHASPQQYTVISCWHIDMVAAGLQGAKGRLFVPSVQDQHSSRCSQHDRAIYKLHPSRLFDNRRRPRRVGAHGHCHGDHDKRVALHCCQTSSPLGPRAYAGHPGLARGGSISLSHSQYANAHGLELVLVASAPALLLVCQ